MTEQEPTIRARTALWLRTQRRRLASQITDLHFARAPSLAARWGEVGKVRCMEDAAYHLDYLTEAVSADAPALFLDYVAWAKVMLESRWISGDDLANNLDAVEAVLDAELSPAARAIVIPVLESAIRALPILPPRPPPVLAAANLCSGLAARYLAALLSGERRKASDLILEAVEGGVPVSQIYNHVLKSAQYEMGRLWQMNQISVAQEHLGTAITQQVMGQLYPRIFSTERIGLRLVTTCVADELHELGARMISDFFEMAGWDTYYLGANTPLSGVLAAVVERRADLLAISATITRHVPAVAELVRGVRACPRTTALPILVGGYPFNVAPALWQHVGADGSESAPEASVLLGSRLVEAHRTRAPD
jgi:methanogenic corrinoid protein MtbC1